MDTSRIDDRVDRNLFGSVIIAVIGIGMIGGSIAWKLAQLVPWGFVFLDGDTYEEQNRVRHVLPKQFVGDNKARAMAAFIGAEFGREGDDPNEACVEQIDVFPFFITDDFADSWIVNEVLAEADIVVIATDDVGVQRRVAQICRMLDKPAIVPGVSADGSRGEVFVVLGRQYPCLQCYEAFRAPDANIRGAAVMSIDFGPIVDLSVAATLALVDPTSREAGLFARLRENGPPPQLFRVFPAGAPELQAPEDGRTEVLWRPDCPGCGGQPGWRRADEESASERLAAVQERLEELVAGVAREQ